MQNWQNVLIYKNLKWVGKWPYTSYLSFSVSGEYYLGFVDAKYNAGRPRPGEVQHRYYTLNVWQTQCVYWREKENRWSRDGCWATDMSTYAKTHCRLLHYVSIIHVSVLACIFMIPASILYLHIHIYDKVYNIWKVPL